MTRREELIHQFNLILAGKEPWSLARVPTGILTWADTLARERYDGTPLRLLPESAQRDCCADAESARNDYKERN